MRRNRLRFSRSLQHKQLRQNSDTLQPDAKRPGDFVGRVVVREQDCYDSGAAEQVLYFEGVEVGVVGRLVGCCHEVDCVAGGGEEEDLVDGVVGAVGEGPEDVEVAGYVDDEVEGLGFEGYSCAGLGGLLALDAIGRLERSIGDARKRTFVCVILCNNIRIDTRWERSPVHAVSDQFLLQWSS
jgi:hypothetical protein